MEKELLDKAEQWKKTALEELAKCAPASRSEFANQMLLACAEILEWKVKNGLRVGTTGLQVQAAREKPANQRR